MIVKSTLQLLEKNSSQIMNSPQLRTISASARFVSIILIILTFTLIRLQILSEPARGFNIFWLLKIRKFTIKQSGFDDNSVINSPLVSNKFNSNLNYRSYESLLFIAPLAEKLTKEDNTLDSRFHFATFFSLSYSSPMVIRTKPWQTNRWALFSPRLQTTSALIFLRTPVALSGQCGKKK